MRERVEERERKRKRRRMRVKGGIENERGRDESKGAKDGAFDLRNRSLNRMYWVIELCGRMTSQDFLNKLLIIPP